MIMHGLHPGTVTEYDAESRRCRVKIDGVNVGGEEFPEAEIKQNLGDRSEDTEIRIKAGDRVWLAFFGGDPRYPIIDSFRAKNTGNMIGTRHWEHANFTSVADHSYEVTAVDIIKFTVSGSVVEITPEHIKSTLGSSTTEIVTDTITHTVGTSVTEIKADSITSTVGASSIKIETGEITVKTPKFTGVEG